MWRYANDPALIMRDKAIGLLYNRVWVKALGEMPDDPVLHTATLLHPRTPPCWTRAIPPSICPGVSIDLCGLANHSVWFHPAGQLDDWVLYSTSSPVAADSRLPKALLIAGAHRNCGAGKVC